MDTPSLGPEFLIRVNGVTVVSADTGATILKNVSLEIGPRDAIAILGPSGAGKTTLALAAIGALPRNLRLTAGTIDRPADKTEGRNEVAPVRQGSTLVPQGAIAALPPLPIKMIL